MKNQILLTLIIMRKKMIIDDFGINNETSCAIIEILELDKSGFVTEISCLTNGLDSDKNSFKKLLNYPVKIGLHLSFQNFPANKNPSTLKYFKNPLFLPYHALKNKKQINDYIFTETTKQINLFIKIFNQLPDFIDSHQHLHQVPGLRESFIRAIKTFRFSDFFYVRNTALPLPILFSIAIKLNFLTFLKSLSLSLVGYLTLLKLKENKISTNQGFLGSYHLKSNFNFTQLLDLYAKWKPQYKTLKLHCHIGKNSEELEVIEDYGNFRDNEYFFFKNYLSIKKI